MRPPRVAHRLQDRLAEFERQLERLPEATAPPQTTLQILGRENREQDWQRLLFHFLSPTASHGLEYSLLDHFLTALSARDDFSIPYSRFGLERVQVALEVLTSNGGRPDAVVWSETDWFVCFELKIRASETGDQTAAYVSADVFSGIDLVKADVPADGRHYVYLAPASARSPAADEFVHVTWEWVADQLQRFFTDSHGTYPAATTAQLSDFVNTIERELHMTEYEQNQRDRAKLYIEYYDEIETARQAFEREWEAFAGSWGDRLAQMLDRGSVVDIPALADSHVAVKLTGPTGDARRWHFRQGDSDWGGIVKEGWWLDKEDLSPIYAEPDDDTDVRMSLYHRLKENRDLAVGDATLELQLWHGTSNGDEFMYAFKDQLEAAVADVDESISPAVSLTGRRGNPLVARYDIPVADHDEYFDAYVAALRTAVVDLTVEYPAVVTSIDESFEETLEIFR